MSIKLKVSEEATPEEKKRLKKIVDAFEERASKSATGKEAPLAENRTYTVRFDDSLDGAGNSSAEKKTIMLNPKYEDRGLVSIVEHEKEHLSVKEMLANEKARKADRIVEHVSQSHNEGGQAWEDAKKTFPAVSKAFEERAYSKDPDEAKREAFKAYYEDEAYRKQISEHYDRSLNTPKPDPMADKKADFSPAKFNEELVGALDDMLYGDKKPKKPELNLETLKRLKGKEK